MYNFLRERGIQEDILQRMQDEKITIETVAKLGQNNQELAQFLCIGDRMELFKFCTKKPAFDISGKSKRKKKHFESIKKKMMLAVNETSEHSDESDTCTDKKHKMIGNQNAKKSTRIVEFGWYHDGVNVRGRFGGGARKLTVAKTCTKDDLLEEAKNLYFPFGVSRRNIKAEDCTFTLRDFMHNPLDDGVTVGALSDELKFTGRLRFYMYSTGPSLLDQNKCKEVKPATVTSETDSTCSLPLPKRKSSQRKLLDFPFTDEISTEKIPEAAAVLETPGINLYPSDSTAKPSHNPIEQVFIVEGNYWPPSQIDSDIIFGRDPNKTDDLSETILDVPLEPRDTSSPYLKSSQQSTSFCVLQPASPSLSPLYDPQLTPLYSFERDPLTSTPLSRFQQQCSSPNPTQQNENLAILQSQQTAILTILQSNSPCNQHVLQSTDPSVQPETQSANPSILFVPQSANQKVPLEPQSADTSVPLEPQSANPSVLPEPQSANPKVPLEPQSANSSVLPEPQSANPKVPLEPQSANSSVLPEPQSANPSVLSEPQAANPSANQSIPSEPQSENPSVPPELQSENPVVSPELQSENSVVPPEPQSVNPSILFEPQTANYSNLPEPRSPTPPPISETKIKIRRTVLEHDMIESFKDEAVLEQTLNFTYVDERGLDVQGVSRDAYTCFWEQFVNSSTKGEQERVPSIMPKLQKEDWMAIGRILLKGFCDHGIFPIQISRAFFVAMLYGEVAVSQDLLIESFKRYVTEPERLVVEKALQGILEDDEDKEEFADLLCRMECVTLPSTDAEAVILQVAHTELMQQGKYALDAISSVAKESLLANLPTPDCLLGLYKLKEPTSRKILKLLKVEPSNTQENTILKFLKQFIRGMSPELMVRFLHFVTGAQVICVDKIEVAFNKTIGLARVPIARTCGPVLELSISYSSFTEFRQEFINVLSSQATKKFDID